jgi:hypothetical protein
VRAVSVATIANPYANLELRIPDHEWEAVRRYTTTFRAEDGSSAEIDESPFDRYVDLWWAAFCLGVRDGHKTVPARWHTFVTGVVLNQDPWRIRQLELVAMADEGPGVLEEPGRVVALANEYAATGITRLIDELTGRTEPVWALTNYLRSTVDEETEPSGEG